MSDLTWIGASQGWALGTAPCTHPPCTSVVHTLDGGRTWGGLPAPVAYLEGDPAVATRPGCSATVACVRGIRFSDANIGYVFGVSSLSITTNGGHTWSTRASDATDALEVTRGMVVRVTHPGSSGCGPDCPFQVQAAAVGSTDWHTMGAPTLGGVSAQLAVDGLNLYVAALGHTSGGAGDAHTRFARSTDGGGHWSTFADPCTVTPSGDEADATAMAPGPGGYLAVACTPRASNQAGFVVVSGDGGTTFGPHRGGILSVVPVGGETMAAIAAPTGQRLAVLVLAGGNFNIAITNDAGADWTVTHVEATPATGPTVLFLGFEDATTGRAAVSPSTILTTTDGGGHWTPFSFP